MPLPHQGLHSPTCLDTLLQLPNPTISALSIMLVRLLFWDSLAGSISRSLCPVITLITPQSFQPWQSLPVILIPNSLLGTITSPIALLSWWFFELPVHGGRCSLVALWGWYLPLKTDKLSQWSMWKNDQKLQIFFFWGFFGAAFASSPSHSWWVLRYTAWLSLTPWLHHGTRPWYRDPPAPERLPPPPPPPHETHLGCGGLIYGWAWDRCFFSQKKTWEKRAKILGKKRVKQISGFL